MGMIQTLMKKTPDGKTPLDFYSELREKANSLASNGDEDGNRPEGVDTRILKPEDFEEYWDAQENLKRTPEVKEKYKKLTDEGKVIVVEVDW